MHQYEHRTGYGNKSAKHSKKWPIYKYIYTIFQICKWISLVYLGYCVYKNYSINIQIWILAISCCEAILKFIACRRLPSMTGGLIAVVVIIIIKSSCLSRFQSTWVFSFKQSWGGPEILSGCKLWDTEGPFCWFLLVVWSWKN